jgi:threonine dehydratase
MNGLNCRYPSDLSWPILKQGVTAFEVIGDAWTEKALLLMKRKGKEPLLNSGPSGIAGLAGLLAVLSKYDRKKLVDLLNLSQDSVILVVNTEGGIA